MALDLAQIVTESHYHRMLPTELWECVLSIDSLPAGHRPSAGAHHLGHFGQQTEQKLNN